jgi:hypothetical protein
MPTRVIDDGHLVACLDDRRLGTSHLRSRTLAHRPTSRQSNLRLTGPDAAFGPIEQGTIEVRRLGRGRFDHRSGAFAIEVTDAVLDGRPVRFAIVEADLMSFLDRVTAVGRVGGAVENLFCAASGGALPVSVEHGDLLIERVAVVPGLGADLEPSAVLR